MRISNERYPGLSFQMLQDAYRSGNCLYGTKHARDHIWHFVGEGTIVVSHALHNDLRAIEWIHKRVVDSYVIEFAAWKKTKDGEAAKKTEKEGEGTEADGKETLTNVQSGGGQEEVVATPQRTQPTKKLSLSLRSLANRRLGWTIQANGAHNSLENATADKWLVHWQVYKLHDKV